MTPEEVAAWMLEEVKREEYLLQQAVVCDIAEKFGDEFTYINDQGNMAIRQDVLEAFKKISPDFVWLRGERAWRKRDDLFDEPGRRQD